MSGHRRCIDCGEVDDVLYMSKGEDDMWHHDEGYCEDNNYGEEYEDWDDGYDRDL